jgi:hypothetical protein
LFDVKKTLKEDMDAARLINISNEGMRDALSGISNVEINSIDNDMFRPMTISNEIRQAFADNAARIGAANPLDAAYDVILNLQSQMRELSLSMAEFPVFENPLLPIMQDTPITPTSLNLPNIDANLVSQQVNQSNYNNLTTAQKIDLLFGNYIMAKNALQKIEDHEKLCRIMQKQTHDKIHKLERQINRIESILLLSTGALITGMGYVIFTLILQ